MTIFLQFRLFVTSNFLIDRDHFVHDLAKQGRCILFV